MTHMPGTFQVEEIQQIFNSGANIIAVKMLRIETDCSLSEAVEALKSGTVAEMPTFKTMRARRRAERYGPQLLAALKALIPICQEAARGQCILELDVAGRLVDEVEKE